MRLVRAEEELLAATPSVGKVEGPPQLAARERPGIIAAGDAEDAARRAADLLAERPDRCRSAAPRTWRCRAGRRRAAATSCSARAPLDWPLVNIWFCDERCVPADDEHSNLRLAREKLGPAAQRPMARRRRRARPTDGHGPTSASWATSCWTSRCSASARTATPPRCSRPGSARSEGPRGRRQQRAQAPARADHADARDARRTRSLVLLVTGREKASALSGDARRTPDAGRRRRCWHGSG